MPQGRKKVPFSGKAKKEQLKHKKQHKNTASHSGQRTMLMHDSEDEEQTDVRKLNTQPARGPKQSKANRYALQFYAESAEDLKRKREEAQCQLAPAKEEDLEIDSDEYFVKELDFPKRPQWSYDTSRDVLEAKENRYFTEYIKQIEQSFDIKSLSYFELNLETWRQLWRVLEMSDIVLHIVDIRFASLLFPPSLYQYVSGTLRKDMILVLNKIDLVPAPLVVAWRAYFKKKYPELHVVMFTSLPGYSLRAKGRRARWQMAVEGTRMLLDTCMQIVDGRVDLSSWKKKIEEEMQSRNAALQQDDDLQVGETITLTKTDTAFYQHERYKSGILTIGCVGQPNVGKSSLMNAIKGRKVVSISKTPGHTKHFQTIFLTETVRLCDCPGLVFPSRTPRTLQILMGSFPIAQLRDPYTAVRYLAEHSDLVRQLNLGGDLESALDVCEAYAKKRGYITAKAARYDVYRAANAVLRMALQGKISFCLFPKGYVASKDFWRGHGDVELVLDVQARSQGCGVVADESSSSCDASDTEIGRDVNQFSLLSVDD